MNGFVKSVKYVCSGNRSLMTNTDLSFGQNIVLSSGNKIVYVDIIILAIQRKQFQINKNKFCPNDKIIFFHMVSFLGHTYFVFLTNMFCSVVML